MHSSTRNPIKTIVVDDNILIRSGIRALLLEDREVELLLATDTCEDLLVPNWQHHPDVLLISSNLLLRHHSDSLKTFADCFPYLKIIVLSTNAEQSYTDHVAHLSITGHLIKDMKNNELIVAIKIVHDGGIYFSKSLTSPINQARGHTSKSGGKVIPTFSDTEKSILELCCKGLVSKEIAGILQLAPKTIEHYKERMNLKTGSKNSTSLVVYALVNNIISKEWLDSAFICFFLLTLLNSIFKLHFLSSCNIM